MSRLRRQGQRPSPRALCGRPMGATTPMGSSGSSQAARDGGAQCLRCKRMVTPVVTSVGGGSRSFGRREKWTCPSWQGYNAAVRMFRCHSYLRRLRRNRSPVPPRVSGSNPLLKPERARSDPALLPFGALSSLGCREDSGAATPRTLVSRSGVTQIEDRTSLSRAGIRDALKQHQGRTTGPDE